MLPVSSVFHTVVTVSINLKTPPPGSRDSGNDFGRFSVSFFEDIMLSLLPPHNSSELVRYTRYIVKIPYPPN